METFERIKMLRKHLNLSQERFGKMLGVNRDVINNIERNRLAKPEQKEPLYRLICETFHVNYKWLILGEGEMFSVTKQSFVEKLSKEYGLSDTAQKIIECYLNLDEQQRESIDNFIEIIANSLVKPDKKENSNIVDRALSKTAQTYSTTRKNSAVRKGKEITPTTNEMKPPSIALKPKPNKTPTIQLKHSIYKVSAGSGYDLNDPDAWEVINVPDTSEAREADFALTVEGDSMEPDYSDGDIVLVRQQSDVEIGKVGVFIVEGAGYIKERGENCLISRNPDYHNIYGEARCVGKVLGKAFEDEDETEE